MAGLAHVLRWIYKGASTSCNYTFCNFWNCLYLLLKIIPFPPLSDQDKNKWEKKDKEIGGKKKYHRMEREYSLRLIKSFWNS